MSKQREALELALDALEDYQVNGAPFLKCDSAIAAIREALAEPEQEPVAWMMVNEEHGHKPTLHWKPQEDWHITWKAVPLYAAPPVRKPLTDDEVMSLALQYNLDATWNKQFFEFARAIERAHGIE